MIRKAADIGQTERRYGEILSSIELMMLLADREWLDDATKTTAQFWKRENARRDSMTFESLTDATPVAAVRR